MSTARCVFGFLFVLVLSGVACFSQTGKHAASRSADGLFDIGGRKMFLSCSDGAPGRPTVILESGMNETSASWSTIVPQIAAFTRVCVYDRAGLGKSESAGDTRRSSVQIVADLRSLLRTAGVEPPYVMVGHSFGGLNARLFAATYPTEVVGIVLVDSVHEDETARWLELIPAEIRKEMESGGGLMLRGGENIDLVESERQMRSFKWRTEMPLIVLARGGASFSPENYPPRLREFAPKGEELRISMQRDLASRSSRGRIIFAEKSGHFIHHDEPALVVKSIEEVLTSHSPKRTKR
jgi:pimeloyl-ACP methyl ester carboxylesterase